MYTIIFQKAVHKQLAKLPKKDVKKIYAKISQLPDEPRPSNCKTLHGNLTEYFRIRSGKYRIIYTINDNELIIVIVKVSHRKDVYESL